MKSKSITLVLAIIASLTILFGATMPNAYAQRRGAAIDKYRLLVIKSPDAQLIGMQTGQIDFLPELIRPADIETLGGDGYLITSTPGFHMGFVGYNLKRPFLDDVRLREALFRAYNQEEIVASIYKYTVTPVQSLIPPAQGGWMNPALPKHPFNPGDITDPPGTKSTFGIMKDAGYTYHGTGYGDPNGYWEKDGVPLPTWHFWTPTYEVAPTSAEHGARITEEWHKCGFNNIIFEPMDFNTYTSRVFDDHDFDIFMIFWRLSRFPLQLYGLCHSSEYVPGSDHAVGLNDTILDGYLETMKYSLDLDAAVQAAWDAQERLYDPDVSDQALAYMLLYSRVYFNAAAKQLTGIVNEPGYGSDNAWTEANWRWTTADGMRPGTGDSLVIYCNGEEPSTLNYLALTTVYEANIVEPTQDVGIAVNPYTLGDVAWQITEVPSQANGGIEGPINVTTPGGKTIVNGMKVTYHIRDDIYWQDGNKYEADDAVFSLNFLKNNEIPQYITYWQDIEETHVVDALTYEVYANVTSLFLVYYWDAAAFLCPPQVWSHLDGAPLSTILGYGIENNATDTGPWSYPLTPNGPRTQVFGTGLYVFEGYNPSLMYADLHNWDEDGINLGYFMTTQEVADVKTELFHQVGDVTRDGWVWGTDLHDFGLAYGTMPGDEYWDPDADINYDGIVEAEDGIFIAAQFGNKKELGV